ncbi:zinc finger protein 16-like isoform X2 [Ceratina calcarata]|uniref:Zinc finger protein 16-like isoform X2 n=1 Tax=Ceratina calcarata TaxID=156304 RepID=A0AAJ7NFX2_9HYME|nr:zinc finger protein 16-like isoform X2 [Ceratina calcarata]
MSEYDSMSFSLSPEGNCKNDKVQMQSINLVCPVCDAGYINKKEFYSHLRIHAGDVLLKQVQCSRKDENDESETEPEYSSQKKIVDNFYENILRPFKCQQCELTFDRASQYDYHHRSIHLGEKSQLCEICGKSFFRKTDLRTHLNIHLGTNICICEVCGKKFNHISNLIRHCRMHSGVKLYPCSICGKRFTQISSLARHKRIHERTKDDAKFQNNSNNGSSEKKESATSKNKFVEGSTSNLQKVVKRQHYCKICGESFNFIFLLREHEKSHSRSSECKNDATETVEFKEQQQPVDNIGFLGSETNVRNVSPLDTIIYITSEQLKKINLENIEDSGNCVSRKDLCEERLLPDEELNVSDKITFDNEQSPLVHDNPFLLCKSDESVERDNISYICQDENVRKTKLCPDMCESNLDKSEPILNYDTLISSSVNVTDMFQRIDLSEPNTDDINLNCDPSLHKNDEANNLAQNEKLSSDLNDANNIVNQDEPMLRLVQTETGEQFYEFLINNLVEKLPKILDSKNENINLNEENHQEQSLRDDMNNELNYSQYELQGEEKGFSANQILLDTQTDFEKYVESNFEVFERLNYDDSPDRFLEFVETAGLGNSSTKISDCNEESEQFLQFQNFGPIDAIPESEKSYNTVNNENENGNGGIVETNEKQEQSSEGSINNNEQSKNEQDLKKLKTFLIKFQCTVCEKSFSTSYNYKQHIGTHFADQQKFHCKDCNMSFAWKSTLNKHIANNHRPEGPQKFACDICNKIYNTSSQVNEHVKRDHLKQRNHVCSQCGKSFFKKYDLKIHNRIHTDERPYVCRACGKRFHHRSHIVRHERIHF